MELNEKIPINGIGTKQLKILCYPKCQKDEIENRLQELKRLKIQALEFAGEKNVFGVPVLGKGCVGIVLIAYTDTERAALKIRRIDSDRKRMFHEGQMLKKANSVNVGPKLFKVSENFLLMELVEGKHFPEWIQSVEGKDAKLNIRLVLANILEQCYRLDEAGLDHGELSKAPKHIIVKSAYIPYLIDFETASINRRVTNVTSVCQYLFFGSQIAYNVKEKLGQIKENELINTLRLYKKEMTRKNFEKILDISLIKNADYT